VLKNFFSAQGNKTDIFSCKSAAQDIFFPIYFAAGYFFASHNNGLHIAIVRDVAGVFSQRRPRELNPKRGQGIFTVLYFIWLCLNVPHTKACRFTYKKCITAPKPKTDAGIE
jgi:hypothetical protein